MRYYGTLGPACTDRKTLVRMFKAGMTGMRLNTSHTKLSDAMPWIIMTDEAAKEAGVSWELLADLQGPEVRIGKLGRPFLLSENGRLTLYGGIEDENKVTVPEVVFEVIAPGQYMLLDDSKIRLEVLAADREKMMIETRVVTGGMLESSKSMAIEGVQIPTPVLTENDIDNLIFAGSYEGFGKYGLKLSAVMQPFVRSSKDLEDVREALRAHQCGDVAIMAKIESRSGVEKLSEIIPYCDEIIIARGDLGMSVTLQQLPVVQKRIEKLCIEKDKPFMVVTQMLNSMIHSPVPTRAEVSDIANAVFDGAASLMLTGETASGKYPAEAMEMLIETAGVAIEYSIHNNV